MKIYLVRHGETEWNKRGLIQGITNNPLNDRGRNQAYELKHRLSHIEADLVVSSSLSRAIETANIALDIEPDIIDDSFIERNFGGFEGVTIDEFRKNEKPAKDAEYERDEQIVARVMSGLNNYVANQDIDNMVIFCHSHVLKAVMVELEPMNYTFKTLINNCAVLELEVVNGNMSILEIF